MSELNTSKKPPRTGSLGFVVSTVKIAIAIVLSTLILTAIGIGIGFSYYRYQQNNQIPYAMPKYWELITLDVFENTTFSLTTKWEGGYLYYQFDIEGYPSLIKKHFDEMDTSSPSISIRFYDSYEFLVYKQEVSLNEFSRSSDKDGVSGLNANSKVYMGFNDYKKIASWSIGWKLR